MMRLDKFLSACQAGTRSEVKKYIRQKLVTVNGTTAISPEQKIDETSDKVCFRGCLLVYEPFVYYLLYKPAGCVTAVRDSSHKTVMAYLPQNLPKDVTPVGRLDLDTEGLLLLTNDGVFAHHIISPSHHLPKTYEAVLDVLVPDGAVEAFARGIDIGDDTPTLPAKLEILSEDGRQEPPLQIQQEAEGVSRRRAENAEEERAKGVSDGYKVRLTITEGRYHQVKRMFAAVGCKVLYLKRISIGGLTLEALAAGEYRKLSPEEVRNLEML